MTDDERPGMARTRMARWSRTVRMLRSLAVRLRAHDFQVIEPDNLDTPPERRSGAPS